jgi:hypothetical protein
MPIFLAATRLYSSTTGGISFIPQVWQKGNQLSEDL